MFVEPLAQCLKKRDRYQRHERYGKNGVRDQYHKIDGSNQTDTWKSCEAMKTVVGHIGGQKKCGCDSGRNHTNLVPADFLPPNHCETRRKQERAGPIQTRVEGG